MIILENIRDFFRESEYGFMVYVVEQRFAVGRGSEYFRSFKGKENLIDSNRIMEKRLNKILRWVQKNVPNVADIVKGIYGYKKYIDLADIISAFSKLFSVEEHQAAGPEVIDPIIIQEGAVLQKYLNQMIALHKDSILRPVIIIILKDNDFERAKKELSGCPDGCYLKLIRNSGETEICRVINPGAADVTSFLDAFAMQCFSTCSNTKHDVLLNEEWEQNSLIEKYGPILLKVRTNLLCDEKEQDIDLLNNIIHELESFSSSDSVENKIARSLECMAKLNMVYCLDQGGQLLGDAMDLAEFVDNDILKAHVYRYARLMNGISAQDRQLLLQKAQNIFEKNHIEDHALYCWNNRLVAQFYSDRVNTNEFLKMQEVAIHNVPGLVGMSHLLNNVGVACLMTGLPDESIEYFQRGLDYARTPERMVQRLAILCNILIAKTYSFQPISESELRKTMSLIFDGLGFRLPFISARYAMNVVAIAIKQNVELGQALLAEYPVEQLVNKGLSSNTLGSGQLILQIGTLAVQYSATYLPHINPISSPETVTGVRREFIERYGLNPFFFSTWL